MIEIDRLAKRYGDFVAVDDLTLSVPAGQFTVLLGPSGSGKTTVLRMLNRMVEPTSGTISIDGSDIATERPENLRRRIGYVIQNTGLFPNMTVRRNVSTVPRLLGWDRARIDDRADEMLTLVGLDPASYGDKLPAQLSGGEAQRVGVARALAADPPIMLMDEPFGAVDPITRTRLQLELKVLHARLGTTIVFVTHDIDEAILLADKVVLLRNGVLEQYATADDLWLNPASEFVRDFLGTDLGLRILQRHGLDSIELLQVPADSSELPTLDVGSTLKDALAELVDKRADRLVVTKDGAPVGVATFEALVGARGPEA